MQTPKPSILLDIGTKPFWLTQYFTHERAHDDQCLKLSIMHYFYVAHVKVRNIFLYSIPTTMKSVRAITL